jgi:O-antigen biosynthesis protein
MVSHALRPEIGAVGAKLYDEAGAIAHAGFVLGGASVAGWSYRGVPPGLAGRISRLWTLQNVSAVSAACLVVRRELLERAGGLDAASLPNRYFDVDLCLRLGQTGHRTLWTPYAELCWLDPDAATASAPENGASLAETRRMASRWAQALGQDPNYNPNLSLDRLDGSLAAEPRRPIVWASAWEREARPNPSLVPTTDHSSLR